MAKIDELKAVLQHCLKTKLIFALLYHSISSESAVAASADPPPRDKIVADK